MLYLAYHGWFVANVPLVPEVPPPKALLTYPAEHVFCLNMRPDRLLERRLVRAEEEAIPIEPYASEERVRLEYQYAERLCSRHGWQHIDVTGKAVEEVSREIMALLQEDEGDEAGEM